MNGNILGPVLANNRWVYLRKIVNIRLLSYWVRNMPITIAMFSGLRIRLRSILRQRLYIRREADYYVIFGFDERTNYLKATKFKWSIFL
jgi:hypothetical protein